jgi:hypothetical protein
VKNGQIVKNWMDGRKGIIINSGENWQTIRYDNGEIVHDVPNWKIKT